MRRAFLVLLAVSVVVFAGCGAAKKTDAKKTGTNTTKPTGPQHVAITVTSDALRTDGVIPTKYTCDGAGINPPLSWRVPAGTSISTWEISVVDPDANGFLHWVVTDIPAGTTSVAEGQVPNGASVRSPYRGPCPPKGSAAHHYVFTVIGREGTVTAGIGLLTATYQRAA